MDHHQFKLTTKSTFDDEYDINLFDDYLNDIVARFNALELIDNLSIKPSTVECLNYSNILVKDYNVIQIGVHIIYEFVFALFVNSKVGDLDQLLLVNNVIIHPITNTTNGMVIRWDASQDCLILNDLPKL